MTLYLYNTLTRKKDEFTPLDAANVRMYVCGPTVYGRAHLGNARSVVVYDVLFRLLRHIYGAEHVTYARNITDVDDKINAAAKERKIPISELTTEVTQWFHEDMKALNVLPASDNKSNGIMLEPKATDHIGQMIAMIELLIKNGAAYVSGGNVLFSVASCELRVVSGASAQPKTNDPQLSPYYYGMLSGRVQEELEAGARVKVEGYKRDPNDFVLWKPAAATDDPSSIFESPWGKGRPGWHIECSAMSTHYLGHNFDIHGGGSDLMFPHHENEIAQAQGAYPGSHFARYWVHNGFLTVNGEKMSKSLGNFFTVRDLLEKGIKGEVIRYALLSAGYNKPLDWNEKLLSDAQKNLDYLYRALEGFHPSCHPSLNAGSGSAIQEIPENGARPDPVMRRGDKNTYLLPLLDDLNFAQYLSVLHSEANLILSLNPQARDEKQQILYRYATLLGLLQQSPEEWFKGAASEGDASIQPLIAARIAAKKAKNWAEADRIRKELKEQGILLEDRPDGTTDWRRE